MICSGVWADDVHYVIKIDCSELTMYSECTVCISGGHGIITLFVLDVYLLQSAWLNDRMNLYIVHISVIDHSQLT